MEYSIPEEVMGQLYTNQFGAGTEDMDSTLLSAVRASQPAKKKNNCPTPSPILRKLCMSEGFVTGI